MATEIVKTAFDRVQRELGCEFMDWEAWYWPSHFGDPIAEHHAVRRRLGVRDESPLRKWDFRGSDALAAADRIFTNDMLGLEVGQIHYAPFCDENGKMVGDGTVFKLADDHAWVITALDSDLDHFREVVGGPDVSIQPITEELPHVQRYFRFWPDQVTAGGIPCWGLPDGLLGRARVRRRGRRSRWQSGTARPPRPSTRCPSTTRRSSGPEASGNGQWRASERVRRVRAAS